MWLSNIHAFYTGNSGVLFPHRAQNRAEVQPPLGRRGLTCQGTAQPGGRDLTGLRALQKKTPRKMVPQGHAGRSEC